MLINFNLVSRAFALKNDLNPTKFQGLQANNLAPLQQDTVSFAAGPEDENDENDNDDDDDRPPATLSEGDPRPTGTGKPSAND